MESFGLSVVALAAIAVPGVLFIISFLSGSLVKRTSISFGPAVDIAIFLFLSFVINALYGGSIGFIISLICRFFREPALLPTLLTIIQQFVAGVAASFSSELYISLFAFAYLLLISLFSIVCGYCFAFIFDASTSIFSNHLFSRAAWIGRQRGTTICSILCKFGGENSFVIYIGELKSILINDQHEIAYLSISRVQRSLLRFGLYEGQILVSDPGAVEGIGLSADLVINGSEIENIALSYLSVKDTKTREYKNFVSLRRRIYGVILVPALISMICYAGLLWHPPSVATVLSPASPNLTIMITSQIQLNAEIVKELPIISKDLTGIFVDLDRLTGPGQPPGHSLSAFRVLFDWNSAQLTPFDAAIITTAAAAYESDKSSAIEVSGYADHSGAMALNRALAERRARAVVSQLVDDHVPLSNIFIHAFGSTSVSAKSGAAADAEDRRVEIIVQ